MRVLHTFARLRAPSHTFPDFSRLRAPSHAFPDFSRILSHSLLLSPLSQLATCSEDGTLKIWDFEKSRCVQTLVEHTQVRQLAVRLVNPDPSP